MATAIWRGHISFGLVSIPVRLFRAARSERVNLRELYRAPRVAQSAREPEGTQTEDTRALPASRISRVMENEAHEEFVAPVRRAPVQEGSREPVEKSALTKGFEIEKNRFVTIEREELSRLAPKTSTEMEILEFVHLSEVDPVYFEASYYVRPDEAGEQAYALLFESMLQTGLVALARFAMHRREHIVIVRPGKSGIVAHTMYFESEVRGDQEYAADAALVNPKNLELAKMLTTSLSAKFEPAKYRDTYREQLEALIAAKSSAGQTAATITAPPAAARVTDIAEALRKSLAVLKKPAATQSGRKKARRPA